MDKKVLNNEGKFVPMSDDAKRDFTEHKIDLSEKKVDLRTKEEILKDSIGVLPVKFTQHHIELILSAMESYASLLTSEKDKRIAELENDNRLKEQQRSDWAQMVIKKQARIEELEGKEQFLNEEMAIYRSDYESLNKCVTKILTITDNPEVTELINETVFHLCANMK